MSKYKEYRITVRVKAETEMMAYQILGIAIQKKWLRGEWQYKEGIYQPNDFFEISGNHWKKKPRI